MARENDAVSQEHHEVMTEAGEYIKKRIKAVFFKLPELMTHDELIGEDVFVLDRKRNELLILTFNESRNDVIISTFDTRPGTDPAARMQSLTYSNAAERFNRRKCGVALGRAIQNNTHKKRVALQKTKAEFAATKKVLDSIDIN